MPAIDPSRVPVATGSGHFDIDDDPGLLPAHREMILGSIEYTVTAIQAAVAPLVKRIAALEQVAVMEYRGVWSDSEVYPERTMITHQSSLWISSRPTAERPGSGPDTGWKLAAKGNRG